MLFCVSMLFTNFNNQVIFFFYQSFAFKLNNVKVIKTNVDLVHH